MQPFFEDSIETIEDVKKHNLTTVVWYSYYEFINQLITPDYRLHYSNLTLIKSSGFLGAKKPVIFMDDSYQKMFFQQGSPEFPYKRVGHSYRMSITSMQLYNTQFKLYECMNKWIQILHDRGFANFHQRKLDIKGLEFLIEPTPFSLKFFQVPFSIMCIGFCVSFVVFSFELVVKLVFEKKMLLKIS